MYPLGREDTMAKRRVKCRYCGELQTIRHGRRKVGQGTVQRFVCLRCGRSFTLRCQPKARISYRQQVELTRLHLEGRTSIRTLARHTHHSTKTIIKAIHTITAQCASAAWIAEHLKPRWSGYLALDGKMIRVWDWSAKHFRYTQEERRWLHKMSLLVALDLQTLDLPAHHLGSEETAIDLTMFLQSLKSLGYPLKGYVSDGNPDIPRAVERVFGRGLPHQLCLRHFLQNLRTRLREGILPLPIYREACQALLQGRRPRTIGVPNELFTYQQVPQLPLTNQACENLLRFFALRLKTIGQFQDWKTAANYCKALTLMRRFTPFTDRKSQPNGQTPLELAGCHIKNLDYLTLSKTNR
jgi:transposase-like protein